MAGLLRPHTISNLKQVRAAGQQSVIDLFTDTWVLWERERPTSWDDGSASERWTARMSGTGKLTGTGTGGQENGPQIGDGLIYPDASYQLRLAAAGWNAFRKIDHSEPDFSPFLLVVNGSRLFGIDVIKFDDADDLLATAYLTEVLGKPLPVEGMP